MKGLPTALCLAIILIAATGFAQKITTDWDRGADFTKFKTYAYAKGTPVEDPLMDQRVVDAIEAALEKEGIKKVDSDPDMYVTYHASAKENKQYVTDNFGYGYGARWGGGMGTSTTRAYSIREKHHRHRPLERRREAASFSRLGNRYYQRQAGQEHQENPQGRREDFRQIPTEVELIAPAVRA